MATPSNFISGIDQDNPGIEENVDHLPASANRLQSFDESSLAGFLNDIMIPFEYSATGETLASNQTNLIRPNRDFLDFGTPWVDFLELDGMLAAPEHEIIHKPKNSSLARLPDSGNKTPVLGDNFTLGKAAFSRSIWQWTPTGKDHSRAEKVDLSLPYADVGIVDNTPTTDGLLSGQNIDRILRDKLLARILSTCSTSTYSTVVMAFPSAELLTSLMHLYLNEQWNQIDSWLHVPTFDIAEQQLELLITMIGAGAIHTTVSAIRKVGLAFQEAAREALAKKVTRSSFRWDCF